MLEIKKKSFLETISLYFKKKMARILLLGIIQGFPFVLIYSALGLWLRDNYFSRSQVGFLSLIGIVYGFNWLWAPIVDRIRIPWLTNKIGHRKSWIVVMQSIIFFSLILCFCGQISWPKRSCDGCKKNFGVALHRCGYIKCIFIHERKRYMQLC